LREEARRIRDAELMHFGETIQRIRHELGLSQADLVKEMGWSLEFIDAIENGKRRPHIKLIEAFYDQLGLSISIRRELDSQLKSLATIELGAHRHASKLVSKKLTNAFPHAVRSAHTRAKKREQHYAQSQEKHVAKAFGLIADTTSNHSLAKLSQSLLEAASEAKQVSNSEVSCATEEIHPAIISTSSAEPQENANQNWIVEQRKDASDEDFCRALGLAIKECRKQKHLTQEQLAQRVGTTRQEIRNFEIGQGKASIPDLSLVAHALSVRAEEIVERAQKKRIGALRELLLP
jgi:transcriptional regulator with XRE-family HTH domain